MSKSYSHKPHLASLPYDHNTDDVDKLKERKKEIEKRLKSNSEDIGNQWKKLLEIPSQWNKNLYENYKKENEYLEWESEYYGDNKLQDLLISMECTLKDKYNDIDGFNKKITTDFTYGYEDGKIDFNFEDYVYKDINKLFEKINSWCNQEYVDWNYFKINNMSTFKKEINTFHEKINILEDYNKELERTNKHIDKISE